MATQEQVRDRSEERRGNNGATEQLKAKTGEMKSEMSANMIEIADIARAVVEEKWSELESKKEQAVSSLETRIQERPLQMVAAAAGAGLLLGMILRR